MEQDKGASKSQERRLAAQKASTETEEEKEPTVLSTKLHLIFCPFRQIPPEPGMNSPIYRKCDEEDCALWDKNDHCCGILSIRAELRYITSTLYDVLRHMKR